LARSNLARLVALSCNPATFVRDARNLIDAGFSLELLLPVDQFLWSPHIELAASFTR
ncbi:MAG: RNA methyltransferase, partial [Phenylobacterium sp.]|nr:RNA methyltransferase [Phenylobacterium sp.]